MASTSASFRSNLAAGSFVILLAGCTDDAPTAPDMAAAAAGEAAAVTYSAVRLGALGGVVGEASDMLDGRIVGHAETADGSFHAFLWENGRMRDLGALPNSTLPTSWALALNSLGQVVGFSLAEDAGGSSADHAFLWRNGAMTDLGTLGGISSRGVGINDAGIVVGFAQNASGNERAVRWRNGVIEDLGTLGGEASAATGINEAGVIVGFAQTGQQRFRAFVWRNGSMRSLPKLDGVYASASAINAHGLIVGSAFNRAGQERAVLWQDGKIRELGVLSGDQHSVAMDLDDAGRITGYSYRVESGEYRTRVFIWEKGIMRNLGNSAGKPNRALGIAPAGHLVGSSTENGNQVAVLWRRR